jgi:hypothetical protein
MVETTNTHGVGEKRKRKLQYLQQLVNNDSDSHQDPEPSPEQHEIYPRSLSADYQVAGPSSSPYIVPSDRALRANSAVVTQAILAATAASFDTNHVPAEQAYPPYQPTWNASVYSPPPPPNIPWNMPPAPDHPCTDTILIQHIRHSSKRIQHPRPPHTCPAKPSSRARICMATAARTTHITAARHLAIST